MFYDISHSFAASEGLKAGSYLLRGLGQFYLIFFAFGSK